MRYMKTFGYFLAGFAAMALVAGLGCDQLTTQPEFGGPPCMQAKHAGCPHAKGEAARPGSPDYVAANLWMASAEYEALCLQTYAMAYDRILERVKEGLAAEDKPMAVVMDLDETVMDNSLFESWLAINDVPYSDDAWKVWEKNHADKVGLVPGSLEFIKKVRALGVDVAFISNRFAENRASTIDALVRLGVIGSADEVSGDREFMLQLSETGSSKEARRLRVEEKYSVIGFFGDTLGDFSRDFDKDAVHTREDRKAAVEKNRDKWGTEWFVLPNPTYGHWLRPIDESRARDFLPRAEGLDDLRVKMEAAQP